MYKSVRGWKLGLLDGEWLMCVEILAVSIKSTELWTREGAEEGEAEEGRGHKLNSLFFSAFRYNPLLSKDTKRGSSAVTHHHVFNLFFSDAKTKVLTCVKKTTPEPGTNEAWNLRNGSFGNKCYAMSKHHWLWTACVGAAHASAAVNILQLWKCCILECL